PGTNLIHQSQHVVIRKETLLAPAAIVISSLDLHFPMHRQDPPLLIRVKLRGILAMRTGHAAPYVPLFFRLATPACRTSFASFSPASRNSKSMAPNSSASGTSTARSTSSRTAASILGRSSFMIPSMRSSRDWQASLGTGRFDIAGLRGLKNQGEFPTSFHATTRRLNFPPK